MKRFFGEFRCALRRGWALLWMRRRSPAIPAPRPAVLLALSALWLAAFAGLSWLWAGESPDFNEYGLNSLLAGWAVFLIAIIIVSRGLRRAPLARAFADVLSIGLLVLLISLVMAIGGQVGKIDVESATNGAIAIGIAGLVLYAWQLMAIWRAGRSVFPASVRHPGLKLLMAALLPMLLVPDNPLVRGANTPAFRVDIWSWADIYRTVFPAPEIEKAETEPQFDYEAAIYRQPAIVQAALDKIAPSSGDMPQFYYVGAAPSSYHSVFKREVESARAIFDERFASRDRSLSLVNDIETSADVPLASMTNLTHVLDGIGHKMNKDRDVLVLFITSHGSEKSLQVWFPGIDLNPMTSASLAKALDASGIKNRVIIVSACHSGSLIPGLEGPDTLILTAAHAEKTSFGCSNDRDWTYFGDAFFNHALRETRSFTQAFDKAKALIAEWEKKEGYPPSEPQISAGGAITPKLDAIARRLAENRSAELD